MNRSVRIYTSEHNFYEVPAGPATMPEIASRQNVFGFFNSGFMLPNPDPILKKMGRDIYVYKELLSDSRIGSHIENRMAGTLTQQWEVFPPNGRGNSDTLTQFITDVFKELPIEKIIAEMLESVCFGYRPMEVSWEKIGSHVVPVSVVGKPSEWFGFSEINHLMFKSKEHPMGLDLESGEFPYKFLLPRNKATYDNPYGLPILSRCFWYVVFKRGGFQNWSTFGEKYGMPWAVGRYRIGAGEPEREKIMDALQKMVQDAVAVVPEGTGVEIIERKSTASADMFKLFLDYCDSETAIAILGHTGTTQSTAGKLGEEKTALTVRGELVDGDKRIVCEAFNQLIKWIVEINFSGVKAPQFGIFGKEEVDVTLSERDAKLRTTGWKPTARYFVDNYNMREEWFEIDQGSQAVPGFPPKTPGAPDKTGSFSEPSSGPSAQQTPSEGIASRLDSQASLEELWKPIEGLIDKCHSMEELRDKIIELYAELQPAKLGNIMEQAFTAAELAGRYEIQASTGTLKK